MDEFSTSLMRRKCLSLLFIVAFLILNVLSATAHFTSNSTLGANYAGSHSAKGPYTNASAKSTSDRGSTQVGGVQKAGGTALATTSAHEASAARLAASTAATLSVGTGGPILLVSSAANKFSSYTAEILLAEGLNEFGTTDISALNATMLSTYDVVILGEITVTSAQVSMLSNWVETGGLLIAFRPSAQLAPLMGLSPAGGTLSDKYLLVHTESGPGKGIVSQTIQFHSAADLYTTSGATRLATLYSTASTATSNPAVSVNNVGVQGGKAVAFTYDLARSIVYTRQGNPAWAGQERDGQPGPIRSNDMFYPDWVDLNKVDIPQADEQQRLLANIILHYSRKPLPRLWYLPRGLKAAVVMTGDDHANAGTRPRFNQYLQLSEDNSAEAVADWRAIRGSSYIYPNTPMTDAEVKSFEDQGFEIALHLNTNCANYTASSLESNLTTQLADLKTRFPSLGAPTTNRTHCIAWSDWATQPKLEAAKGIRLDANYYYWPGAWVGDRPGMFTGSGLAMRFADLDGSTIDCYQLNTQMTDESGQSFPFTIDQLLNKALGAEGYYGIFCANMHTDAPTSDGSDKIIASAKARNVPVISSKQLLKWLDGRNSSSFSAVQWNGSQLSFNMSVAAGAHKLEGMLPLKTAGGHLVSLTANGNPVTYRTETIKGIDYAFYPAATGSFQANYVNTQAPVVSITSPVNNSVFSEPASITIQASATDADGSIAKVEFFQGSIKLGEDTDGSNGWSFSWSGVASGTYSLMAKATDNVGAIATSSLVNIKVEAVCPCTVFKPTDAPGTTLYTDNQALQLGMRFRAAEDGFITGVRFYKQTGNIGTHIGQLYNNTGTLLAEATFVNETASGWQEVAFPSPVAITANTTYVISYHSSQGYYSASNPYFTQAVVNGPMRGLATGEDGPNGLYRYTATPAYPTQNYQSANYWVDAVFQRSSTPPNQMPSVNIASPANGASFTAPANINIQANATDADGSIAKVEFFQGSIKLGEDTDGSNGWSYSWNSVSAGNYALSARATDNAGGVGVSATVNISVNTPANTPPVLQAIGNKAVNELTALTFTAVATDAESPASSLTFSLANPATGNFPAGATITTAGAFSWTPTEAQGPGTYRVKVVVSDGAATAEEEIQIQVNEVNLAPVLAAIGNKTVNELSTLSFTSTATDADLPANTLSFSLASAATGTYPSGASITAAGAFSWTPTEAQGPGTYRVRVVVSDGTASVFEEIQIQVNEVNQPPVLASIGDKSAFVGQQLSFTLSASDEDLPQQTLRFSSTKLPTGATLDSGTGVFSWTPASRQTGSYKITFKVSDGIAQVSEQIIITVSTSSSLPVISSFSPTSGSVGTAVTISGSNFTGASSVAFNGVAASYTVVSASSINTTVPAGASTGSITVTTAEGTASSSSAFTVTSSTTIGAPIISSFSPGSGPVGTLVTISGANLAGATSVKFGSTSANINSNTDTEIVAVVPNGNKGSSKVKISVTTAGGTVSSTDRFTITSGTSTTSVRKLDASHTVANLNFAAYPNPSVDKVTFSFVLKQDGAYTLSLYDTKGALVTKLKEGRAAASEQELVEVDVSALAKGLYLVMLRNQEGTQMLRLLITK